MLFPAALLRLASLSLALAPALGSVAHGQWSSHPLSVPRSAVGAVTAGSRVIIAGGLVGGAPSDAVDIYDDATGIWSTSTLPSPAWGMTGLAVGPYALFVGGSWLSDVVYVFDTRTDQWSTAALSEGRSRMAAVRVGSKAIFAGGDSFGVGATAVDVYDHGLGPPSDPAAWSRTDLVHPRAAPAGFAVDGQAAIAGGENALASAPWIEVFGPDATSAYETQLSSGFIPLAGTGVGPVAVLATFGFGIARFETLDVNTGAETIGPAIPLSPFLAAATLGDRALFAGSGQQLSATDAVHIFNSVTGLWDTADLLAPDRLLSPAVVGTKALFAGGAEGMNVLIYDDRIGTTYCAPAVPNSTGAPASISAQGAPAIALGGSTRLNVTGLPAGSVGYVVASQTQGLSMPALSQGPLCLGGTIARLRRPEFLIHGPTGSASFDHAAVPGLTMAAILPGETWNYQCWYRDANPGATSNFTDAVSVLYL